MTIYFDGTDVGYIDINAVDNLKTSVIVKNEIYSIKFKEILNNTAKISAELRTVEHLIFKIHLPLKNYFALLNITTINGNYINDGLIYKLIELDSEYHVIPNNFDLKQYIKLIDTKGE